MTSIIGIIGDPIAQARSPDVFNALFRERRVDAIMAPMLVSVENFEAALLGLRAMDNVAGLVITVPHKAAAARLMKGGSQRAKMVVAANALRPCAGGWEGDLFDGEGFVRGMQNEGRSVRGAHCSVVGCGGAGAAISFALLEAGVKSLSVWDIDLRRAETLGERLRKAYGKEIAVARADSTTEIGERIAEFGPRAITATKLVLNAASGESREQAIDQLAGALVAATTDKVEGVRSFLEKRKPNFTGE